MTVKRQEFLLSDPQADFFESESQFSALLGGIGSGKSYIGVLRDITTCRRYPGILGAIMGPTNDNLKQTTTRKFFELIDTMGRDELEHSWNKTDRSFVFKHPVKTISAPNRPTRAAAGSEVLFRGMDDDRVVDRIRGMELGFAHIDEAPLCPALLLPVLAGRLRQKPIGEPDLDRYPLQAWLTGTHKGKDWVYRMFEPEDGSAPIGFLVHTSVYDNRANLPEGYIESLEALYKGEWAKQELLGLHAKFEGLIYQAFDRAIHVVQELPTIITRVGYGVDWGYHYAPIIPILVNEWDQLVVGGEWYGHNVTLDDQVAAGLDLVKRFGDGSFYPDPSRPENIIKFKQHGLHCPEFEPGKIDEGIAEGNRLLAKRPDGRPGLLVHKSAVNWINEAESYLWDKRSGFMDGDAAAYKPKPADGQQDHAMDATRYGWMGMRTQAISASTVDPDPYYTMGRSAREIGMTVRRRLS